MGHDMDYHEFDGGDAENMRRLSSKDVANSTAYNLAYNLAEKGMINVINDRLDVNLYRMGELLEQTEDAINRILGYGHVEDSNEEKQCVRYGGGSLQTTSQHVEDLTAKVSRLAQLVTNLDEISCPQAKAVQND